MLQNKGGNEHDGSNSNHEKTSSNKTPSNGDSLHTLNADPQNASQNQNTANQNDPNQATTDNVNHNSSTDQIQLSVSAEDGSLLTASLSTVIAAACDALYDDIYNMTHGEIAVAATNQDDTNDADFLTSLSNNGSNGNAGDINNSNPLSFLSQQNNFQMHKMSSLSFAQRRSELGMRLAGHSRSVFHLSALLSHYQVEPLKSSQMTLSQKRNRHNSQNSPAKCVRVASETLKYVRNAWIRADEAQDALYFSHGALWGERRSCADIYGALDMICATMNNHNNNNNDNNPGNKSELAKKDITENSQGGTWVDFPRGLGLQTDRYEGSREFTRSKTETLARLQGAIRRKLVLGEIGYFKNNPLEQLKWRVILEKTGGVIKLTHGEGKIKSGVNDSKLSKIFPIEARVTVLSEDVDAEWRLLSIEVNVHPRTGESSHQLEPSNRQKFDLHRLCEETLKREEEQIRLIKKESTDASTTTTHIVNSTTIPRPLKCLFNVVHAYATSLQLEMLSAQAEALRRGAWSQAILSDDLGVANKKNSNSNSHVITVTPLHYFENEKDFSNRWPTQSAPSSAMAIHFWSCDNRHGTPQIGDLSLDNDNNNIDVKDHLGNEKTSSYNSGSKVMGAKNIANYLPPSDKRNESRLSLCFRAVPNRGIVVSISGGVNVMEIVQNNQKPNANKNKTEIESSNTTHLRRNVEKLLSSVLDPFQLSSSHALLYATVTCAHLRCVSLVQALLFPKSKHDSTHSHTAKNTNAYMHSLPPWMHLSVDCGTISVSIQISYDGDGQNNSNGIHSIRSVRPAFEVFRLACDSRTGNFVTLFPPESSLLRSLVCNDPSASEIQQYRSALLSSGPSVSVSSSRTKSNTADIGMSSIRSQRELTGRVIRGTFESLSRSLNILGRRVGVGVDWNNDQDGDKLRKRAIDKDCEDVQMSLMSCCGIAAIFGTVSRALAIATGTDAVADLAGGPIEEVPNLLPVPPVSIILRQEVSEKTENGNAEETRKLAYLQRDLFAVSGSVSHEMLTVYFFDVTTQSESPSSIPNRLHCNRVPLMTSSLTECNEMRNSDLGALKSHLQNKKHRHLMDEVLYLVNLLDRSDVI